MFKTLKQIKTDMLDDGDSKDDNTMLDDYDNNADKTVNTKSIKFGETHPCGRFLYLKKENLKLSQSSIY